MIFFADIPILSLLERKINASYAWAGRSVISFTGEKSSHLKNYGVVYFQKNGTIKVSIIIFIREDVWKIPVKEKNGANYDVRRGKEKM